MLVRYKVKAIYMLLIAGTLSYATVILKALIYRDFGYLEVHELTYIYGMFLVFFTLYQGTIFLKKREKWLYISV